MGGKGSGGARPNSGPKPKDATLALVHGSRASAARMPEAVIQPTSSGDTGPVTMPEGLPDDVRAVWGALAPLALAEGTLTASRVPAFAHFCRLVVLEKGMAADDARRGLTVHQGMIKLVTDGYARFRLTGDGRSAPAQAKPKALSPLETLMAQKQARAK